MTTFSTFIYNYRCMYIIANHSCGPAYIQREINLAIFTKQGVFQTYLLSGEIFCFCWVSVLFGVPELLRPRSKVYLQSRHALYLYPGVQPKSAINPLWTSPFDALLSSPNLEPEPICCVLHICKQRHIVFRCIIVTVTNVNLFVTPSKFAFS